MNVAIKILVFLVTLGIIGGASILLFGFMIVAMNGFNESDAGYGIILYVIWAFVGAIAASAISVLVAHLLVSKKHLNAALSGVISVVIFVLVGIVINIVGVFAGLLTANIARTQF